MGMGDAPDDAPWLRRWRGIRRFEVVRTARITPHLLRVTLGGPEARDLADGVNIKLLVPPRPGAPLLLPMRGPTGKAEWPAGEPAAIRTYTVRDMDIAKGEIDIDFVLHGDDGPASAWAARARPGDAIGGGGIGGREIRPCDWLLLAGDHTALPAISRILERLPATARGVALVELPDAGEELPLRHPPGMALRWLHHAPAAPGTTTLLADAVAGLAWPATGQVFAWVGAESAAARAIRAQLRDGRGLDRRQMLVIGYWKRGVSETEYGAREDHDRDADYHRTEAEERAARE